MRRFYQNVHIEAQAGGFSLSLDDKPLKTPLGLALWVPTGALAEAVRDEWLAQASVIEPDTMPITRLAVTALDRIKAQREPVLEALIEYGGTDLLCYPAHWPEDLARQQKLCWQPILDWCRQALGVDFKTTTGLVATIQPPQTVERLKKICQTYDEWQLSALQLTVWASGSLILGLALFNGYLTPEQVIQASQLDEAYQAQKWGEDPEALQRLRHLENDIQTSARFLRLSQS